MLKAQDTLVQYYVREGLENNLALQMKTADYDKSLAVLQQAKAQYFPSFSLNARYTVANGGRTIDFPVGDLLNPVYQTLNMLTASTLFPTIENQTFNFYRPTEHETKVELVQPLFNPMITYNYRINRELTGMNLAALQRYKRELVAGIKTAYFTYLKMVDVNKILERTLDLVRENIRMHNRLYRNHKISADVLYRSKAELSRVEGEKAEAESRLMMARNWFNFLLNRPLEEEILLPDTTQANRVEINLADSATILSRREETREAAAGVKVAALQEKMVRRNQLPTLFAVVDYGFQGEEYRFNMRQDFTLASIVLRWDLFRGLENRARIREAAINSRKMENYQEQVRKQILMEVDNARRKMIVAQKKLRAAGDEREAAEKGFRATSKKYEQGMVPYLEYLDALTTLSHARLQAAIAVYDYLIAAADYERATASYAFENSH